MRAWRKCRLAKSFEKLKRRKQKTRKLQKETGFRLGLLLFAVSCLFAAALQTALPARYFDLMSTVNSVGVSR